jgi:hypothetical protein
VIANELIERVVDSVDVCEFLLVDLNGLSIVRMRGETVGRLGNSCITGTVEEGVERIGCSFDRFDSSFVDYSEVDDSSISRRDLRRFGDISKA